MTIADYMKQIEGKSVRVGNRYGVLGPLGIMNAHVSFDDGVEHWYSFNDIELVDEPNNDPLPLPG